MSNDPPPLADDTLDPFYSDKESADWLTRNGVPIKRATLRRLRYAGGGPDYYKAGRRVTYRRSDLEKYRARVMTRRLSTSD